MRAEGEQQSERVDDDKQDRQADAQIDQQLRRLHLSRVGSIEGTNSVTVASNSMFVLQARVERVVFLDAMAQPPSRNDAPSMNRVLATIAPAIDALTSSSMPARSAVRAITSSVRLPRVALRRPPIASPVFAATCLGRMAEQRGERHDGRHGEEEEQRVRLGSHMLRDERDRRQRQQPEDRCCAGPAGLASIRSPWVFRKALYAPLPYTAAASVMSHLPKARCKPRCRPSSARARSSSAS